MVASILLVGCSSSDTTVEPKTNKVNQDQVAQQSQQDVGRVEQIPQPPALPSS